MADSATIPTHLDIPEISSTCPATPSTTWPPLSSGRDIYAVTAPLVVEAASRVLAGAGDTAGVASLGARFDAVDFLGSLTPNHLTLG